MSNKEDLNNDPNYIPYTKVVGEPEEGAGPYDFAKATPLDAKSPIMGGEPRISEGYNQPLDTSTVESQIRGPQGEVETTASTENLSAKYKNPRVSQDTVAEDRVAKPGSSI